MSFDTLTVRIPNALKDLLEHIVHERLEAVECTVDHLVRHYATRISVLRRAKNYFTFYNKTRVFFRDLASLATLAVGWIANKPATH